MERMLGQDSPENEATNPAEGISQSPETTARKIELPEATIEAILEKTQDITAFGTPFTVIGEYRPDSLNETLEAKKESVSQRRKTYEQFKKADLSVGSRMSYEVPLASYSPDDIYHWYVSDIKNKNESKANRNDSLKKLGVHKMGLSLDKPTAKAEFMEKYAVELARQKDALENKLQHEYQEYLQDLEDEIHGASPERYKRKYKGQQFSYAARRNDLLPSDIKSSEDGINAFYKKYVDLIKTENEGGNEYKTFHPSWTEIYKERLAKLGLYKPAEGELADKKEEGDDNDDEYEFDYDGRRLPASKFIKTQSEIIDKKEFTERYLAALKEQGAALDAEAEKAYEKYIADFKKGDNRGESLRTLRLILQNGIFGGRRWDKQGYVSMEPSEWAKDVREKRADRKVYFNMTDYFHNEITHLTPKKNLGMGDSFFFREHGQEDQPNDGMAIVFDMKGLKYKMDDPNYENGYYHNNSLRPNGPDSQYGFAGPARVAPRKFEGIVISCTDTVKQKQPGFFGRTEEVKTKVYSTDKAKWQKYANDVAEAMMEVDKDKPERLIPIYDIHGNMLWPVEMSKEEIKKKLDIKKPNE